MLGELERRSVPIVRKISGAAGEIDDSFLYDNYEISKQEEFGRQVIRDMGFDFSSGRLDVSAHPFTSGSGDDVRITTRYRENDLKPSLFAMIHEAGHALYEQGFRKENYRTPMAEGISLGIHESQSRLWENLIGRSREFWDRYYPVLRKYFPEQLGDVSQHAFYAAINKVAPSLIRVEADEVTYNLHVILRYELEKALFENEIEPSDLPEAWNERMEGYLGVTPENDADGVLQDIHWSMGYFGYFPTYSLGNIYAAQIFGRMREDAEIAEAIAGCDLLTVREWLGRNIHRYGKLYTADELSGKLFGRGLSGKYLIEHVRKKFGAIYGVAL